MAIGTHPKLKSHHKKARGAHHRHSKHYLKTYSPYLPLLLIVVVGLAINTLWTSRIGVLGASTNLTAVELLQDTNRERNTYSQDGLRLNSKLSAAAQSKANDMAKRNYWSHNTPDGDKPWKFITGSGYDYYAAGENLAYGFTNSAETVTGWMNSREHRANLLNPDYQEVGFGIMTADNFQGRGKTTIIVAIYAEPSLIGSNGFSSASTDLPSDPPMRSVARVQLMTNGEAAWSLFLLSLTSILAVVWFMTRHIKIWKRVLVESEEFVVRHKMLDILIVATAVTGFVLTRSAGFIH